MDGFVNILKPVGATASDVAVCVRHVLHEKCGHLGTLDPGASGVLPVAVGRATRLFDFLTDKTKYYRAYFTFGKTTDTLDSYGKICGEGNLPSKEQILGALPLLTGNISQMPPSFSAISVGGVRAYKLARNGEEVTLQPREVYVSEFSLLRQYDDSTFVFDIRCSAGTYIRSLARDLATACGTVAYMSCLIRLSSGCFDITNSFTLDEFREKKEACVVDLMYPLRDVEECILPDRLFSDLSCGRKISCPFEKGYRKIYCKGVFFGLARNDNGRLDLKYYLKAVD